MIDENQIYVVVDIENNGPTPGLYSMLALGAVATTQKNEVSTFYQKLLPLAEASEHPETMRWWKGQDLAWKEVQKDAKPAHVVMQNFVVWLESLQAEPVFVSHPLAFYYTFVSWYLYKFIDLNPFEKNKSEIILSLDLRTYISGKFGKTLSMSSRSKLPELLSHDAPIHTHNALEDAQGYAVILRNVLNTNN